MNKHPGKPAQFIRNLNFQNMETRNTSSYSDKHKQHIAPNNQKNPIKRSSTEMKLKKVLQGKERHFDKGIERPVLLVNLGKTTTGELSRTKESNLHCDNIFKCQYCPQSFKRIEWLEGHMSRTHKDIVNLVIDRITEEWHTIIDYFTDIEMDDQSIIKHFLRNIEKIDRTIEILTEQTDNVAIINFDTTTLPHWQKKTYEKQLKFFDVVNHIIAEKKIKLEKAYNLFTLAAKKKNFQNIEANTNSESKSDSMKILCTSEINNERFSEKNSENHNMLKKPFQPCIDVKNEEIELIDVDDDFLEHIAPEEDSNEESWEEQKTLTEANQPMLMNNDNSEIPNIQIKPNLPAAFKEALACIKLDSDNKYKCPECESKFKNRGSLTPHYLRIHMKDKSKICPQCDRSFSGSGDLTRHMRIHTGDRPFQCTYSGCTLAFIASGDLYKHMRRHTRHIYPIPRNFVCKVCNQDFDKSYDLKRHEKKHTVNDPDAVLYKCDLCSKISYRKDQFKQHMRRHR